MPWELNMEIIEGKGYFYNRMKYFAGEYPNQLALGDARGRTASMKDIMTVCEETGQFLESIGFNGLDRVSVISESGFSQCMIHLPLGEKAAIVPIDYNASSGAMKEKFELFHVDYIITDEPEGVQVKTATDAGLGVITYSLQGERGDIHIDLKLVLKPSDSDRGATVKRKHHLFIMPTSGTTSTPKIVPLNYRAIQSAVEEIGERYKVGPGDVFLTPVSLSKIASMTLFRMFGLGITFIWLIHSFPRISSGWPGNTR